MPPLHGIRVVDLTQVLAGPFCTMMLGDMGAEVLKIEEPGAGDDSRGWAPFTDGWSSYFLGVNRSKRSLALDLKEPAGANALRALVSEADVLVENFRPGSLAQLGFGYAEMARLNPRLVYCSISGYGQSGPRSDQPGYDVVIQAEAGLMDVTGPAGGPPTRPGIAITDYLAGLYAAVGILLALFERNQSGKGQQVDISLFDSLMSVMTLPAGILFATGSAPSRMGNDHPSVAPYETFEAGDGLIVVAVGNPRLWCRFCEALALEHLIDDSRFRTNADRLVHRAALKQEIGAVFSRHTVRELIGRLQARKVPCGPVRSVAEALSDPLLQARDMLVELTPTGLDPIRCLGNPIKLSRTPYAIEIPPPQLGEHTEEALREVSRAFTPPSSTVG